MQLIGRFNTGAPAMQAPAHAPRKPQGATVAQQKRRVANFASNGTAALKADDDWQEF